MASQQFSVVGAFVQREKADSALDELRQAGFGDEQLGIAQRGETTAAAVTPGEKKSRLEDLAAAGAAAGGTLGAVAGAVASGMIPGIGQVIAAGALAGILGGTAVGAAAGGMIGALIGLGIPEDDARYYDREFTAGRTIVAIRAGRRSAEAAEVLRRQGAYSVSTAQGGRTPD